MLLFVLNTLNASEVVNGKPFVYQIIASYRRYHFLRGIGIIHDPWNVTSTIRCSFFFNTTLVSYDTFDDCECNLGYFKQGNACIAQEGLCSLDYVDMVQTKQDEVDSWIEKAYAAKNDEEMYGYLQKMDLVLTEAWSDYNKGKASCEMYVFDDDSGERRLRCCSRLRNGFKKAAEGFKRVAKAVARVVVELVEIVVDVVTEIVECGVGIATDGVKCGLVGCAFGLIGVSLDIAFTLATGGLNKVSGSLCGVAEIALDDEEEEDVCKTQRCKEQKVLSTVLIGIGTAVCEVNRKIKSSLLGEVCDVAQQLDAAADNPSAFLDVFVTNAIVFRFAETFRTAMCGSPGSGVFDLLEEVVNCQIGCADERNAFCADTRKEEITPAEVPAIEPPAESPVQSPTEPPKASPVASPADVPVVVEYLKHGGKACRTGDGGAGKEGTEYTLVKGKSEDECETLCSDSDDCKAYEYFSSSSRCEVWHEVPQKFEERQNFDCFVKL